MAKRVYEYLTEEERAKLETIPKPQRDKVRARIYAQRCAKRLKFQIFEKLGNVCRRCGYEDWRALQIDHVNGGGCAERKALNSCNIKYYQHVLSKDCIGYQLLCANCNWIKVRENEEYRGYKNKGVDISWLSQ